MYGILLIFHYSLFIIIYLSCAYAAETGNVPVGIDKAKSGFSIHEILWDLFFMLYESNIEI